MPITDNLTTTSQVDPAVGVYYDKVLLAKARPKLLHGKWAQKKRISKHNGTTAKFRRYASLSTATTPLLEGTTPAGKRLSKTDILVQCSQFGDFVHITDVVDLTVEDAALNVAGLELGDQMGRTLDELVRDILVACASQTTFTNGDPAAAQLNKVDIDAIVKLLLSADADMIAEIIKAGTGQGTSPIRAAFWGIMHTDLIDDLEKVAGFKATTNYSSQGDVQEAEWGSTGNVRWQTSSVAHSGGSFNNPFAGLATSNAGHYYYLPIIGKNAYGEVELDGGNATNIIKAFGSGGTSDPLNQRATSGWKAWHGARLLNDSFMHVVKVQHSSVAA